MFTVCAAGVLPKDGSSTVQEFFFKIVHEKDQVYTILSSPGLESRGSVKYVYLV